MLGFAQSPPSVEVFTTPGGALDYAFDRFGTKYNITELQKPTEDFITLTVPSNIILTNHFAVFFEQGCGMEDDDNLTHMARRSVLYKVLDDVSKFLPSPLSTNPTTKVNIWIRNINNITTNPNQTLSIGSNFYTVPKSATGTIADAEVWKIITSGKDSYTNVTTATNAYYL